MKFGLWYWNADEFEIAYLVVANRFHMRGNGVCHFMIHARSLPVGTRRGPNCESFVSWMLEREEGGADEGTDEVSGVCV